MAKKIETLFQEAQNHLSNKDLRNAKMVCEDILSLQPNSFMALTMLGIIASTEDGPQKALEYFNKAILINPIFSDVYYNKAVVRGAK